MRRLIGMLLLTACADDVPINVLYELPAGAPSLEGKSVRITIGEEGDDGFKTLVGAGGSATADPATFDLVAPEGDNRRARVLIYQGNFTPVLHGQSDPFSITDGSKPTEVTVKLGLPPDGSIVRTRSSREGIVVEMQARRWSSVRVGLLPEQPTHEGLRPSEGPETDMLETFAFTYPLDMVECTLERGCPLTLFADFLSADGVAGPTSTSTLTIDVVPPSLSIRTHVERGTALGTGTELVVSVEASEPVANVALLLQRTIEREGTCDAMIGPIACAGADRNFTCTTGAPAEDCDGSYNTVVIGNDRNANVSEVSGAEIAVDNIAPVFTGVSVAACSGGIMVVSGRATGATQVSLQDAAGNALAWTAESEFRLAATASVAESVSAIDAGANEVSVAVSCP